MQSRADHSASPLITSARLPPHRLQRRQRLPDSSNSWCLLAHDPISRLSKLQHPLYRGWGWCHTSYHCQLDAMRERSGDSYCLTPLKHGSSPQHLHSTPLTHVISGVLLEYCYFSSMVNKAKAMALPPHRSYDCAIDLMPGSAHPKRCLFSLSAPKKIALDDYIKASLASGLIRRFSSADGDGFFFVETKDKSIRPCSDDCGLNGITIKNRYPRLWSRPPSNPSRGRPYSPNWTSTTPTTCSLSEREMNGRQPATPISATLNITWCNSDSPTCLWSSRTWSMILYGTNEYVFIYLGDI